MKNWFQKDQEWKGNRMCNYIKIIGRPGDTLFHGSYIFRSKNCADQSLPFLDRRASLNAMLNTMLNIDYDESVVCLNSR